MYTANSLYVRSNYRHISAITETNGLKQFLLGEISYKPELPPIIVIIMVIEGAMPVARQLITLVIKEIHLVSTRIYCRLGMDYCSVRGKRKRM